MIGRTTDAPLAPTMTASIDGATETRTLGVDAETAQPGTWIGRYLLGRCLGAGGMGEVFEAHDRDLDRVVAIKLVRPRQITAANAQVRLFREAQLMARVSHPSIATIFDIGTVGDRVFIAMELVPGGTLRAHAGRPWQDLLGMLVAAGRGLDAAHAAGVIHRDFKPDNVLLDAAGHVRVADFGVACVEPDRDVAGTPAYMAPEQFDGDADARTDQFAFCVTAYEMLEGALPFAARGGEQRPWARDDIPAAVRAAIDRGLRADPAARWPKLDDLLRVLERAARPRRRTHRIRTGLGRAPSVSERLERHALASEIVRVRTALLVAWGAWIVGLACDQATLALIGGGPLWLILAARLGSIAFHVTVGCHLYFGRPLARPRLTRALIVATFPLTGVAQTILAAALGGLDSPYITGMFIILIGQTVAIAMPFRRALLLAAVTTWTYPLGMLIGCAISPAMRAELADPAVRNVFLIESAVLLGAGTVTAWASHAVWLLGQRLYESRSIGRYRLLERIGRGGMGEVWRAHDRVSRQEVALKILVPRPERETEATTHVAIERFEREIEATAHLSHPNIVRIFDWGVTDDGVWYYAMEKLEGRDLASWVATEGPLPPATVARLAIRAARGLGAAHAAGVVHRDIKPANLFVVSQDGELDVRILDFGIARVEGDDGLTRTGLVGTLAFMAPELIAGASADARADVWSLAATLRYALTGATPREPAEVELSPVILAALDPDPARRPRDGDAFADALAAASDTP